MYSGIGLTSYVAASEPTFGGRSRTTGTCDQYVDTGQLHRAARNNACSDAELAAAEESCFKEFAENNFGSPRCREVISIWEDEVDPFRKMDMAEEADAGGAYVEPVMSNALYLVGGVVAVGVIGILLLK